MTSVPTTCNTDRRNSADTTTAATATSTTTTTSTTTNNNSNIMMFRDHVVPSLFTRLNHNRVSKSNVAEKVRERYIDLDLASACTKSFALVAYYALSE